MARILCIEDEVLLRRLIAAELKDSGHDILEAGNGVEGMAAVLAQRPDLVLCDINMPVMDGVELLSELRRNHPEAANIPFLFLSALADRKDVIAGMRLGADDYLTKPVDLDLLLVTVEARLAQVSRIGQRQQELALNDLLTGMLNRDGLIAAQNRCTDASALLLIEFDHARSLGLALGPRKTDALQRLAADRLRDVASGAQSLARTYPFQFGILWSSLGMSPEDLAESLRRRMSEPFLLDDEPIHLSVSIGIATGVPHDTLLARAESVLEWCGIEGGNVWASYRTDRAARDIERVAIENALRGALAANEFTLNFQPKVRSHDLAPVGVEVLLRWTNAQLGPVSPALFIPVAEETGTIIDIGAWVLREACRQMAIWRSSPAGRNLQVAVNVSPRQLRKDGWVASVAEALAAAGLPSSALILEITESALVDDGSDITEKLVSLRKLGITLSIDDFGTGYSALSYLHRLPFEELKIDQSFVRGLPETSGNRGIVDGIISLGQTLGLKLVAEGVETEAQRSYLAQRGCGVLQGYHIARPMPADAFTLWLAASTTGHG